MARGKAAEIVLSEDERVELESLARRRSTGQGLAQRARIVLAAADGGHNGLIAERLGLCRSTVGKWRERFAAHRLDGLHDEARRGAPRRIGDDVIADTIRRTLETRPPGATHWSLRSMAAAVGHAPSTIHRIWRAFGCSRIEPRPSSSPPTRCSWRRCATSSGSISTRRIARWCSASTRRARSRRWTAPSRSCRCGPARPSAAPTTTSGMARSRCSPRST